MKLSRCVCALESDWRSVVRNEAPPQRRCRAIFGIRATSVGGVSTPNPGFVRPPEGVQSFWGRPGEQHKRRSSAHTTSSIQQHPQGELFSFLGSRIQAKKS